MAVQVYNSALTNQLWYTDKCRISTGNTVVTYQVYADRFEKLYGVKVCS